ncbi:hypothetical protein J6590_017220 [Homalodisca vitripennis]|nr:hypothetical protein J6590_017220 [Homalodisca vitripennis]
MAGTASFPNSSSLKSCIEIHQFATTRLAALIDAQTTFDTAVCQTGPEVRVTRLGVSGQRATSEQCEAEVDGRGIKNEFRHWDKGFRISFYESNKAQPLRGLLSDHVSCTTPRRCICGGPRFGYVQLCTWHHLPHDVTSTSTARKAFLEVCPPSTDEPPALIPSLHLLQSTRCKMDTSDLVFQLTSTCSPLLALSPLHSNTGFSGFTGFRPGFLQRCLSILSTSVFSPSRPTGFLAKTAHGNHNDKRSKCFYSTTQ